MKKHFKISLIVVALATLLAIFATFSGGYEAFALTFGIVCCLSGMLCLFIGVIVAIRNENKDLARAFLLAGGISFLIGTGSCSTLLI